MGVLANYDGKTIHCGNEKLMTEQKIVMATQGEVAGSVVHVAINGAYAGEIHVADTIKTEAKSTISSLKKCGLTTAMMIGDNLQTAQITAKENHWTLDEISHHPPFFYVY